MRGERKEGKGLRSEPLSQTSPLFCAAIRRMKQIFGPCAATQEIKVETAISRRPKLCSEWPNSAPELRKACSAFSRQNDATLQAEGVWPTKTTANAAASPLRWAVRHLWRKRGRKEAIFEAHILGPILVRKLQSLGWTLTVRTSWSDDSVGAFPCPKSNRGPAGREQTLEIKSPCP